MSVPILQRLMRIDRQEFQHRAGAAARHARERLRLSLRPSTWERTDIARVLSAPFQEHGALRAGVERCDWGAVHATIRDHFSHERARFLPGLQSIDETRQEIIERFPQAIEEARRTADALLSGTIDVLGYRALAIRDSRSGDIDWHLDPVHQRRPPMRHWAAVPYLDPAYGDHKVIWEINRHQHWLALGRAAWLTGDDRYAIEFVRQLESWLRQNPPLVGVNWASMLELAFRSLSWLWALAFGTGMRMAPETGPWTVDLLIGLNAQLEHIRVNLSRYFSPNTHLLGEALALYVVGRSLPELSNAERWAEVGREVLLDERTRQINPDGGHAELSPHYHRYALDFYLLALSIARRSSDAAAETAFEEAAGRLAAYMRAICDDRGRMPLIGDDDGGQTFPVCGREPWDATPSLACAAVLLNAPQLAIGHLTEEAIWLAGPRARISTVLHSPEPRAASPRVSVTIFPNSGYHVARTPNGDHLVFDAGAHGFLNGGHAHADALQVVFTSRGRPLLIDPGTSTYTMAPEVRDRFRGTRMHNTALVDRREQSETEGPFRWRTRTDSIPWFASSSPRAAWFEAQHQGYAPVIHRRGVLLLEDGACVVLDYLISVDGATHEATVNWHLAPEWLPDVSADGAVHATTADGAVCHLVTTAEATVVRGGEEGLGWCAPVYGQLEPAFTITARASGRCPLVVATVVVPERTCPRLLMRVLQRDDTLGTVLDIVTEGHTRRVISWTELRGRAQPSLPRWSVDEVSSRARVLVIERAAAESTLIATFGDPEVELASSVHAEAP